MDMSKRIRCRLGTLMSNLVPSANAAVVQRSKTPAPQAGESGFKSPSRHPSGITQWKCAWLLTTKSRFDPSSRSHRTKRR
jgi:hypothetical protein